VDEPVRHERMRVARPDGESVAVPAEEPARAGGSARTWLLLLLVTALSFALRLGAVGRLLPVHPEPDSSLAWVYRSMMGEAIYHPEQHLGVYPDLLPRLLTLVTVPMRLAQQGDPWGALSRRRVDLVEWKEGLLRRAG